MNFLHRIHDFIYFKITGNRVNIDHRAIIKRDVQIDKSSRIGPWVIIDGEGGSVEINKNCTVNAGSWIGAGESKIKIGSDVRIGAGVKISCAAHNFDDPNQLIRKQGIKKNVDINIGNDCWLGMNAVVLPGVTISQGAVIGAGAVVSKDIPPYAVAVGVPAEVIKYRGK